MRGVKYYALLESRFTILSDISLNTHGVDVVIVARVTVVLEVLFLPVKAMVLGLVYVTRGPPAALCEAVLSPRMVSGLLRVIQLKDI